MCAHCNSWMFSVMPQVPPDRGDSQLSDVFEALGTGQLRLLAGCQRSEYLAHSRCAWCAVWGCAPFFFVCLWRQTAWDLRGANWMPKLGKMMACGYCRLSITTNPYASLCRKYQHMCKFLGTIPSNQLQYAQVPFWNNIQIPLSKHLNCCTLWLMQLVYMFLCRCHMDAHYGLWMHIMAYATCLHVSM